MLTQLTPGIRGLILDADGVLWKDATPIGDLTRIFGKMRADGLQVMLATNNATVTVERYVEKLAGFGAQVAASEIVTSAIASAAALSGAFPQKGAVFVVGETGLTSALCEAGFRTITDPEDASPVVAVIAGMDRALSYAKIGRAMSHIREGAAFYGTNPDVTFPTPAGLVPGAGSVIAAVQAAAAREPIIIGKPSPYMFTLCMQHMGLLPEQVLVVGDRLETDIAGGQAVKARTALVLTGVSTRQQADSWTPRPDLVATDLAALVGA